MKAVILAGGLGTRLRPFTEVIPKPLLPIGESSVLEIQILSLKKFGFDDIFIATNYRSEYVEAFLGNGSKYGVSVTFSKEEIPLGTCGPVTLLADRLTDPFVLMNGDILTTMDFAAFYQRGLQVDADLLVMTKEIVTPFNFGKIIARGEYIIDVQEKPDLSVEILAGVYLLKPAILAEIPRNTFYGIDTLITNQLRQGKKIARYLSKDYWLDIGRIDDFTVAQNAYETHFSTLKK